MPERGEHLSDRKRRHLKTRDRDRSPFEDVESGRTREKRSTRRRKDEDEAHGSIDNGGTNHANSGGGGGSGGGGDISLSINDTNALRAKLGLAPLEIDGDDSSSAAAAAQEDRHVDNQLENYVHAPAKDLRKARDADTIKEKLSIHKDKRELYDKLASNKLYETSEKEVAVSSWVDKIREKEKTRKQAEERAKLLSDMDEQFSTLDSSEPIQEQAPNRKDYRSSDLSGLRVEHESNRFREGRSVILTLKDKAILDETADGDVLINVNMVDDEHAQLNRENRRKTAGFAGIADEEDDDVLLGLRHKAVLSKYDTEIQGNKIKQFQLGSEGTYVAEAERALEQLHAELRSGKQSLPDTELRVTSEYYSREEMQSKFKKRKRRVKTHARTAITADDLDQGSVPMASMSSDLGSRQGRRGDVSEVVHGDDEGQEEGEEPAEGHSILLPSTSAEEISDAHLLENMEDDVITEDDVLRGEIEKTIGRVIKTKSSIYVKPEEVTAQLISRRLQSMDTNEAESRLNDDKDAPVVFDSTAEFYKSIGSGLKESMRQHARFGPVKLEAEDDEMMEEDDAESDLMRCPVEDWPKCNVKSGDGDASPMSHNSEDEDEEKPTSWCTVGQELPSKPRRGAPSKIASAKPSTSSSSTHNNNNNSSTNNIEDIEQRSGVLNDEPALDSSVFSALQLAAKKGYIEKAKDKPAGTGGMVNLMAKNPIEESVRYDDIDSKFAKRERYTGPLTEFKEIKQYKPDVKLEYVDELGRDLNAKEAFRQLSHKFHGKGSGKNKTDKRMKTIKEEFLLKASASSDTPLGTAEKLSKKLQSISQPYVILSGKNAAVKQLTK